MEWSKQDSNARTDCSTESSDDAPTSTTAVTCCAFSSPFSTPSSSLSLEDCFLPSSTAVVGNAWDLIVTRSSSKPHLVSCSDAVYCFGSSTMNHHHHHSHHNCSTVNGNGSCGSSSHAGFLYTSSSGSHCTKSVVLEVEIHAFSSSNPNRSSRDRNRSFLNRSNFQHKAPSSSPHHHHRLLRFPIQHCKIQAPDDDTFYPIWEDDFHNSSNKDVEGTDARYHHHHHNYWSNLFRRTHHRSVKLAEQHPEEEHSPAALAALAAVLQPGRNRARYLIIEHPSGTEEDLNSNNQTSKHQDGNAPIVIASAPISIFLWSDQERVIVVDVDGTITKSNMRGVVDTIVTESYHHVHAGVCQFFTSLLEQLDAEYRQQDQDDPKNHADVGKSSDLQEHQHRVRLVYLSSRPIKLANCTKKFIQDLRQHSSLSSTTSTFAVKTSTTGTTQYKLPAGPLLCFPGTLSKVLKMELVTHSVHEFKLKTLQNQVIQPFRDIGVTDNILVAGFGNQGSDMKAYHYAGCDKIYLIDKQSKIVSLDREVHGQQQLRRRKNHEKTVSLPAAATASVMSQTQALSHSHHNQDFDDPDDHLRTKGLSFDGYSDDNLMDHISHNPHFTHYQDFFC